MFALVDLHSLGHTEEPSLSLGCVEHPDNLSSLSKELTLPEGM
jgi:hypothetical protein